MNRRKFFGMTATAIALAGLPAFVLADKTIFLPPRFGWKPSEIGTGYMREVSHYLINRDETLYRYDAIARDIWGGEHQYHVNTYESQDVALASGLLQQHFEAHGLSALKIGESNQIRLSLPIYGTTGRYV